MKNRDPKLEELPERRAKPMKVQIRPRSRRHKKPRGPFVDLEFARVFLLTNWSLDREDADRLLADGLSDGAIRPMRCLSKDPNHHGAFSTMDHFCHMILVTKGPITIQESGIGIDGRPMGTIHIPLDDLDMYANDSAYRYRKIRPAKRGRPPKFDWETFEAQFSKNANSTSCPDSFKKLHKATVDELTSMRALNNTGARWPSLSAAQKRFGTKFDEQIQAARR